MKKIINVFPILHLINMSSLAILHKICIILVEYRKIIVLFQTNKYEA